VIPSIATEIERLVRPEGKQLFKVKLLPEFILLVLLKVQVEVLKVAEVSEGDVRLMPFGKVSIR
jgi:hypothetical protein